MTHDKTVGGGTMQEAGLAGALSASSTAASNPALPMAAPAAISTSKPSIARAVTPANDGAGSRWGSEAVAGSRRIVTMLGVLDGPVLMDSSPGSFLKVAIGHVIKVKAVGVLLAIVCLPWLIVQNWCHVQFLDFWRSQGGNTTMAQPHFMMEGVYHQNVPFYVVFASMASISNILACLSAPAAWLLAMTSFQKPPWQFKLMVTIITVFMIPYAFGMFWLASSGVVIGHIVYGIPGYVVGIGGGVLLGVTMRHRLQFPRIYWPLLLQLLTMGGVFFVYSLLIPRWFLSPSTSQWSRALIRVLFHPVAMEIAEAGIRGTVRLFPNHVNDAALHTFLFPPFVMASLLGRFLIANMESFSELILVALLVSCVETGLRVSIQARDYLFYRCFKSKEDAFEAVYSKRGRRVKADILNLDMMSESFGVVFATMLVFVYGTNSAESTVATLVLSMVAQMLIETSGDMIAPFAVAAIRHWGLFGYGSVVVRCMETDDVQQLGKVRQELTSQSGVWAMPRARGRRSSAPTLRATIDLGRGGPASASARSLPMVATPASPSKEPHRGAVGSSTFSLDMSSTHLAQTSQHVMPGGIESPAAGRGKEGDSSLACVEEGKVSPSSAFAGADIGQGFLDLDATSVRSMATDNTTFSLRNIKLGNQASHRSVFSVASGHAAYVLDLGEEHQSGDARHALVAQLLRSQVNTLNAWTLRDSWFFPVLILSFLAWSSYFLRMQFMPGGSMCAVYDPYSPSWSDWHFLPCVFPQS